MSTSFKLDDVVEWIGVSTGLINRGDIRKIKAVSFTKVMLTSGSAGSFGWCDQEDIRHYHNPDPQHILVGDRVQCFDEEHDEWYLDFLIVSQAALDRFIHARKISPEVPWRIIGKRQSAPVQVASTAALILPVIRQPGELPQASFDRTFQEGRRQIQRTLREWPVGKRLAHRLVAGEVQLFWEDEQQSVK